MAQIHNTKDLLQSYEVQVHQIKADNRKWQKDSLA